MRCARAALVAAIGSSPRRRSSPRHATSLPSSPVIAYRLVLVLYRSLLSHTEALLPDDHPAMAHVSLRVPQDLVETFDRLAAALERPRSWVMLRALRQYVDDGEGAEIVEDSESIAELDRGETVSSE